MATTETDIRELAIRIAGFGLPDSVEPDPFKVGAEDWPEFLATLSVERLTGLAIAAAEAGVLGLSEEQDEELLGEHRDAMLWALGLERLLLRLADEFDRRGIEFVVIKGPSFAHTIYPDPSWRPFGDLDLLVRTKDWRSAIPVLEDLGYQRRLPEPRKGFDERFGKAATHRNPDRQEIDLHRTLVLGPFGLWIDPEELIDRAVPFRVGERILRRLDPTATFLEACIHAALGLQRPPIMTVRDIAQSLHLGEIDWAEVVDWADRWHLAPVIRHALITMSREFGTAWPVSAKRGIRPGTSREARALRAYTTRRRTRGGTALATIGAIPGLRAKAAYVRALMLPERRFLRERQGHGTAGLLRRWRTTIRIVGGRERMR